MYTYSVWLDRVPDQRRYPKLAGEVRADVAVIGGGIVGVMAAWRLAQKGKRVVLLEKNHIATGDTGATTGFLTRVPDIPVHVFAGQNGIEFVRKLFAATTRAQQELFELIKSQSIACDFSRCDSYYGAYQSGDEVLKKEWEVIQQADANATLVSAQDKPNLPFTEAIRYEGEGKCNIRKLLFGLLAQSHFGDRLSIFEESEVIEVNVAEGVTVKTREGSVKAEKVIVAVGNPAQLFPELGQVLSLFVTYVVAARYQSPRLPDHLYWDTLDPYFYYRLAGATTVMVGGCDIDARRTATQNPYQKLEAFLQQRIPGTHEVTHHWSGSIFHTADGLPYADAHPHYGGKVIVVTGLGGNGLVMGSLGAQVAADLAQGNEDSLTRVLFSFARVHVPIPAPVKKQGAAGGGTRFVPVGKIQEFKTPSSRIVEGKSIAFFSVEGKFYALENACSHAGGSLSDGTLEGSIIECPLHGAKFDVRTGEVKGPPAVRRQETFAMRVNGDTLEIEMGSSDGAPTHATTAAPTVKPQRKKYWKQMFVFAACALIFWLLEFVYQYKVLIPGEFGGSLVRSFALAGATLFGCALFSSAIFRWFPKTAKLWRYRRYMGVSGFVFTFFHVFSVYKYLFDFDVKAVYYTLNPIENPIIFGSIAFPIFFVLAATSTDWAVDKIGSKRWKFIHRFVYLAYLASIFHFITINPTLLKNPAGYLLLTVTALAVVGMLFWYVKTVMKRGWKIMGAWVGLVLILATAVMGYVVYEKKFGPPPEVREQRKLEKSAEKMKAFMEKDPEGDEEITRAPIAEDQSFVGLTVKQGAFENLNYTTAGGASLEKKGERYYVTLHNDFSAPPGPDLQVYLTKNTEPTRRKDVQEGVLLDKLKSIMGKQVYEIPDGVNVDAFNSVTIHCRAFNVPWSYVPLK